MAHYTTHDLMYLGMRFLLRTGEFDEIIAEMKNYFECYESGIFLSGEVMETLIDKIENKAHEISYRQEDEFTTPEDRADYSKVFNVTRAFLLGILFEYIGHSNLEPDQFVKLITNRE